MIVRGIVSLMVIVVILVIVYKLSNRFTSWLIKFLDNKEEEDATEKTILNKKITYLNDLKEKLKEVENERDVTAELKLIEDKLEEVTNKIIDIDNKRR